MGEYRALDMAGKIYAIAVAEVKTAVSLRSLGTVLSQDGSDMSCMQVDSNYGASYIPAENLAQLVLQMVVKTFNFAIYI